MNLRACFGLADSIQRDGRLSNRDRYLRGENDSSSSCRKWERALRRMLRSTLLQAEKRRDECQSRNSPPFFVQRQKSPVSPGEVALARNATGKSGGTRPSLRRVANRVRWRRILYGKRRHQRRDRNGHSCFCEPACFARSGGTASARRPKAPGSPPEREMEWVKRTRRQGIGIPGYSNSGTRCREAVARVRNTKRNLRDKR